MSELNAINNKQLVKLDVQFEYTFAHKLKTYSIQLALGNTKTFKVNDIKKLLYCLKYKKALKASDNFIFNPNLHVFNKEDMLIIKLIALRNSFGINKYSDEKVYLEDKEVKLFFQVIKNKNFDLIINDTLYENINISQKGLPLELQNFKVKSEIAVSHVKEISNKNTFEIHIDLNYIKEGITLIPRFLYGNIEINPFSKDKYINSENIETRKIKDEIMTLEFIKELGFLRTNAYFIINDFEKIINFIEKGIKRLEAIANVHCDNNIKNIKYYSPQDYEPKLLIFNNYKEFTFGIEDIDVFDVKDIMDALKEGEKYYKLRCGHIINLKSMELRRVCNTIDGYAIESKSFNKGYFIAKRRSLSNSQLISTPKMRLRIPRKISHKICRNLVINEMDSEKLRQNELLYEKNNNKLKEILLNIGEINDDNFIVPEHLFSIMRTYQKVGFKWFKTLASLKLGGILADEMGLGKTLQAISLILSYVEEHKENRKPVIVICPTSLVYNWESEIEKFAPELRVLVMHGNQKTRLLFRDYLNEIDIVITSYGLISKDIDFYANMEFRFCFIDEAQQIKNPRTQASRAVKKLNAVARFALTGTPIENSLSELWSIFDFIMPGYLLSKNSFSNHYEIPITKFKSKEALDSLNFIIKPFILRRLKADVLAELPPKIERKIIIEMTDEQKEAYKNCLINVQSSLSNEISSRGFNRSQLHILTSLMKLRQICCHPSIVMDDFIGDSAKMLALDNILEECKLNNRRILLFSQFITALDIIRTRLENTNIDYLYLDGSTPSKERLRLVEEFNGGKGDIFLISLKAGGVGLNLTGADTVIHFDPWWNPAVEDQATDRAHRIGQTKTVDVIKFVTKGTIEEKILKIHDRKRELVKNVISDKDNENSFISKLSQEEIKELFVD